MDETFMPMVLRRCKQNVCSLLRIRHSVKPFPRFHIPDSFQEHNPADYDVFTARFWKTFHYFSMPANLNFARAKSTAEASSIRELSVFLPTAWGVNLANRVTI